MVPKKLALPFAYVHTLHTITERSQNNANGVKTNEEAVDRVVSGERDGVRQQGNRVFNCIE